MNDKEIIQDIIQKLKEAGADKSQCFLSNQEFKELNVDSGEMSLFRTTFDTSLNITAIKSNKKASLSINKLDDDAIKQAVIDIMKLVESSPPDDANEISDNQESVDIDKGPKNANLDIMYNKLENYLTYVNKTYPKTMIEQAILKFVNNKTTYANSNGVSFSSRSGRYGFMSTMISKEGKISSSMSGSGFVNRNLDKDLHQYSSIDQKLDHSQQQIHTKTIPKKFKGEIIVAPDCLGDFVRFIIASLSDMSMINETSIYKDKLGKEITNPMFSLHSMPTSEQIQENYFFTNDGFKADDITIIERGKLITFLLSLYGSKKTGLKKALNSGGCYIIDAGETNYEDMVKNIDRGLLVTRFSGGSPSDNGDFSGIAKNSFYIQNGKIDYAISETMISGNIAQMFHDIIEISKERLDFGSGIYPWIKFGNITIS